MGFRNGRKVAIAVSAAATTIQSVDVPRGDIGGILVEAKIDIPTYTNAETFTFSILDQEGDTRYSIALLPKAEKSIVLPNRIIQRGYTFGMTPTGVTGDAIVIEISPTYEV